MAMAASRAKPLHFLRQSFISIRTLSSSASAGGTAGGAAAAAGSGGGDSEKARKKSNKKKNLFDVVQFLPSWGLGYQVAKSHWRDVSYQITKINLYKDGRHGKAWGIRYKAGAQAAEAPMRISGVNKRGWKYIKESEKKAELNSSKVEEKITA
ncbi:hypothetical protein LUZ60_011306 [Juncus effusus]|nr:hypothetical protein LUZ60_011306 [Juncus effusus]